ncbi:MAG: lipid core-O-antigen ligase-like enyme, partial [Phycisphaerales bacterium]|nr:lipid core-O-antigen ligase-like enyme [Phycisphaerales bacterium]
MTRRPTFSAGARSPDVAATAAARPFGRPADAPTRGPWLTRAALGLAVAVVIARLFMTESIRSAIPVEPGGTAIPYGPGPAAGLLLDLLAGLCPLLVLVRRWVDPAYALRLAWSPLAFAVLAAWAVVSTAWAGDRFAALVSSCHLLAAAGVLWAVAQIVRTPAHARLLAGVCVGLLGVLLAHGLWYQLVDRADLRHAWETNRDELLKARNVRPGTFEYTQFENKILRGELMGFSASPNTYAAAIVLLGLVVLGATAQFVRDRRWASAATMLAVLAVAAGVLPLAQSRTGDITAALGAAAVGAAAVFAPTFRRRSTLLYVAGALGVAAVAAFVVGYGLSRGTLFHDSLNFRWRYWVGSFQLWKLHPLAGVGWENFGPHYLGVRMPEATEEIKDPHNYLVRFAAELGGVGGLLALAWTARAWWEITRPGPE